MCIHGRGGIYIHSIIIIIIIIITIIRYKDTHTHTINNRFILCAAADEEELNHPKNAVLDPAADLYRFFFAFFPPRVSFKRF